MDLSIIISITGKPGLYKVVGRTKNGLIAESLTDKKRLPVSASDKVSALSDISLFTHEEDMPLKEVLLKMFAHYKGGHAEDKFNDGQWMAEELRKVVPNFDESRVYTSDLKKLFKWYNLLAELKLIDTEEEKSDKADPEEKEEKKAPKKEGAAKKPKKTVVSDNKSKAKPKAKAAVKTPVKKASKGK
jgi:hypothetical protein